MNDKLAGHFPYRSTLKLIFFFFLCLVNLKAVAERSSRSRGLATESDPAPTPTTVTGYPPAQNVPAHEPPKDLFNPYSQLYIFGIEGPAVSTTSIFKESAVVFGMWLTPTIGIEGYLGYSKDDDTYQVQTTTSVPDNLATPVANTVTTAYSNSKKTAAFLLGGAIKYRVYQARYFGVSADFLLTLTPGRSATYQTGTHVVNTPDITAPSTYTVNDTDYGTITDSTSTYLRFGPRLTVDYHLPFLPNLVLGSAVGIFASFGGQTTSTTSTTTQQYQVNSGAQQPPSSQKSNSSTTVVDPGLNSNTYSIGGTGLNIGPSALTPISVVGTFRIRYSF